MIEAFIDGGCEPNPNGVATWGVYIRRAGKEYRKLYGVAGEGLGMSNNVAEYVALLKLFEWLESNEFEDDMAVVIKSDSQMLVKQMTGVNRAKSGAYLEYYRKAYKEYFRLSSKFDQPIDFEWIPRTGNMADPLVVSAFGTVGIIRSRR